MPIVKDKNTEVHILPDSRLVAERAAQDLVQLFDRLLQKQARVYFVPSSGRTPVQTYHLLRTRYKNAIDWRRISLIQMDEYDGSLPFTATFYHYLLAQLVEPLGIVDFIGQYDRQRERVRSLNCIRQELAKIPTIDVALHGIGRNGHIGFNEPNYNKVNNENTADVVRVELSDITRRDNFPSLDFSATPQYGMTLGLPYLKNIKHNFLLALGTAKSEVMEKLLQRDSLAALPASALWQTKDFRIYMDRLCAQIPYPLASLNHTIDLCFYDIAVL